MKCRKCRDLNITNEINCLYFQALVVYKAKTEMYDRSLTDTRSPYDCTEAYIVGDLRRKSNTYAFKLYGKLRQYIEKKTNIFNISLWNDLKRNCCNYSAQKWVEFYNDLCNYCVEMDDIKLYIDVSMAYTQTKINDFELYV